ncbi:MAG TPA: hypothetical protein DC046_06105 [Rhodospirillaceae bacterium]|nr:hypothetical protein [Rhodospirillaceae bacterium]
MLARGDHPALAPRRHRDAVFGHGDAGTVVQTGHGKGGAQGLGLGIPGGHAERAGRVPGDGEKGLAG